MDHQIWVGDGFVAAHKTAGFEVIRRCRPTAHQQPAKSDPGLVPPVEGRLHRDRLGAGVLYVHLQMVLQILTDTGQRVNDLDAVFLQMSRIAHARQLQQLRGVDGTPTAEDLSPVSSLNLPSPLKLDTYRPRALEENPVGVRLAANVEVRPRLDGVQVGARRTESTSSVDVAIKRPKTLLAGAIHVIKTRIPRSFSSFEESLEEGALCGAALQDERSVCASEPTVA